MTTVEGASFVAPAGWSVTVHGPATLVEAPEGDSRIALVDVRAADADAALAAAWNAYGGPPKWPLAVATTVPDKDGWSGIRRSVYEVPPNEKREVIAVARRAGDVWTVVIYDMASAVGEKRAAAVQLVLARLLPRGYARESFAGRKASPLDAARLAKLTDFVAVAMRELRVPGVGLGIVQGGKVVFAGGFGVRELGKEAKPDADTLFMIASNTKALTTLMLAKLVEQGRFGWNTPVTTVLPTFALGDADATRQLLVKHLVCACTGMPRQDLEWAMQFEHATAETMVAMLATMKPTSGFGEIFQYSNVMAAAAGFVGGHAFDPKTELGKAYDEAMRTLVLEPLGMSATTFDFARALRSTHASPYASDIEGRTASVAMDYDYAIVPVRPAGGAWSSVRDMLKFVSVELAEGVLPDGERYIAREPLLERRVPQVRIGADSTYGMGLEVNTKYGTPVVSHDGMTWGYSGAMMWLPEHDVGAVVLTNSDAGAYLHSGFRRKLLEVLFDGKPEADADLVARAKNRAAELAAGRKRLTVPADPAESAKLAHRYRHEVLGDIEVVRSRGATVFDVGEWRSEVATRKNPDGSVSFVTISPGMVGALDFVVGAGPKRTLVTGDGQHEYVFAEANEASRAR